MIEIYGKIYRNLEEQVKKNKDDIESIDTNVTSNTNAINDINTRLDNLDLTYATDEDVENLQSQINTKANQSDLNATNANVAANTANIATNASNIANKANTDASNLTNENVESWKNKCSFERVETIYDKSSTDANINWGYTGGIQDNVQVTGKDFVKYKGLYAFVRFFGETHKIYVDLTQLTQNNEYCSASTNITKNFDGYDSAMIVINSNKSTLVPYFRYGFSSFNVGSSTEFFIYKIEGVY